MKAAKGTGISNIFKSQFYLRDLWGLLLSFVLCFFFLVGHEAGLVPVLGVPRGLVADLVPGVANLTAGPGAGVGAGASLVLLVGLLCQRRARNVVLQVDLSLQHLWIARGPGPGPGQGPDQLTVAIKL